MPHQGKRIKCAGEADEQLIADLENQLENRANQAGNAPGSPKGSKPQIFENDEAYVYPEEQESNLLCYILCGILFGALILAGGWFFYFRADVPPAGSPDAPASTDPVDPSKDPEAKDPQPDQAQDPNDPTKYNITNDGLVDSTKPEAKSCFQKTTDFVKKNGMYIAGATAVVGGVGYKYRHQIKGGLGKAVNWTKSKLGFKGKGPIAAPLTMEDCRSKGMILKDGQCVPMTWSEHPKEKLADMGRVALDANASVYDKVGAGGAGLLNKVGMKIDPKSAKVSSYSYGKVVAGSITGILAAFGIYKLYNFIRNKFWKKAEDPNAPEEPGMCGKLCGSITSLLPQSFRTTCSKYWTSYKRWIQAALAAIGFAFIWFLPAIASAVGLGKALSCVTGPISAGKGVLLGAVGMGAPAAPILG